MVAGGARSSSDVEGEAQQGLVVGSEGNTSQDIVSRDSREGL